MEHLQHQNRVMLQGKAASSDFLISKWHIGFFRLVIFFEGYKEHSYRILIISETDVVYIHTQQKNDNRWFDRVLLRRCEFWCCCCFLGAIYRYILTSSLFFPVLFYYPNDVILVFLKEPPAILPVISSSCHQYVFKKDWNTVVPPILL